MPRSFSFFFPAKIAFLAVAVGCFSSFFFYFSFISMRKDGFGHFVQIWKFHVDPIIIAYGPWTKMVLCVADGNLMPTYAHYAWYRVQLLVFAKRTTARRSFFFGGKCGEVHGGPTNATNAEEWWQTNEFLVCAFFVQFYGKLHIHILFFFSFLLLAVIVVVPSNKCVTINSDYSLCFFLFGVCEFFMAAAY